MPELPSRQGGRVLASEVVRGLQHQLSEMTLHDDTGDERDLGYMDAIDEIYRWIDSEGWLR